MGKCSWFSFLQKLWFLGLKHIISKCSQTKILAVKNVGNSVHTSVFSVLDYAAQYTELHLFEIEDLPGKTNVLKTTYSLLPWEKHCKQTSLLPGTNYTENIYNKVTKVGYLAGQPVHPTFVVPPDLIEDLTPSLLL